MNYKQILEVRELLKDVLISEEESQLYTYQFFHDIYEKNILTVKDNICFSSALIVILCHLSRPLNWFKFNIYLYQEANKPHIPINVYGMNILKSGGGKGLTANTLNNLLSLKNIQNEYIDSLVDDLDMNDDIKEILDRLKIVASAEMQDSATTAGLRGVNKILEDCFKELNITNKFGGIFFNLEEFADTLENATSFDRDFLSTLKNLYDLGNTGAKAINETIKGAIEQFGVSFLASTTEKTLQENPRVSRAFNNYLISGNARRSLFSMPCQQEIEELEKLKQKEEDMSLQEWHESTRYKDDGKIDKIRCKLYAILNRLLSLKKQNKTELLLSEDAYFYYRIYKAYCTYISEELSNEILKVEMESRAWKALKISGILTLYCSVEDQLIIKDVFLQAIHIVEYYGHHLKRYLNNRVSSCADKIVELLIDSNCAITQTELAHNNEVLSYNNKNETPVKFLKSQMEDVEQILNNKGYDLICEKTGYRKKIVVYAAVVNDSNVKIDDKPPFRIINNVPKQEDIDILEECFNN